MIDAAETRDSGRKSETEMEMEETQAKGNAGRIKRASIYRGMKRRRDDGTRGEDDGEI